MQMDIEKRIEKIKKYFGGMKVEDFIDDSGKSVPQIYVTINFPERWIISPNLLEKFNVASREDSYTPNKYYFWTDFECGFNAIFDAIEYNIKSNKTAEEKTKIFEEKLEELKHIFEDDEITVSQLKSLTLNYRGKTKKEKVKKEIEKNKDSLLEPKENNNENENTEE